MLDRYGTISARNYGETRYIFQRRFGSKEGTVWQRPPISPHCKTPNEKFLQRYISLALSFGMSTHSDIEIRIYLSDDQIDIRVQEELCSFDWNFRFKEAAGEHWIESDPWWNGQPPPVLRFLPSGTHSSDIPHPE